MLYKKLEIFINFFFKYMLEEDINEKAFWLRTISAYNIDLNNLNKKSVKKILSNAENGDVNARKAIKLACEALSYSDAIEEGSYSVEECLISKLTKYIKT